ncbi:MAG TPA: endolytic transglycosylase MltG [Microbacteriaceae bacterium]|nr:endolytic transglycosylase MltG [Microbacteriaceae bacterium]
MEKDGGLDDLFGALGDEEPREPTTDTAEGHEPAAETPSVVDASAALNAAFIEAATAPVEPLVPASADPAPEAPAAADAHPALLPPMTRRELRERQRAGETGAFDAVAATGAAAVAPEVSPTPQDVPAAEDLPAADDLPTVEDTPAPQDIPAAAEPEDFVPFVPVEAHEPEPTIGEALSDEPTADAAPQAPADAATTDDLVVEEQAEDGIDDEVELVVADPELAALSMAATPAAEHRAPVADGTPSPLIVSTAPRQQTGRGFPIRLEPPTGGGPRKRPWWLFWAVPLMVIVLLIGYVGIYLFTHIKEPGWNILGFQVPSAVEEKVRELLGWEIPNDYEGTGNGQEAIVTILPGDFGDDVAIALQHAGVTKTFDAFHDLLLELAEAGEEPAFLPGNYRLQQEMSAQSALDALLDPANRLANRVIIPEGSNLPDTLAILAGQTGLPLEEFTAAAADLGQYGLPAGAVSLEGYLFPASYDLDGTETAVALLQRLVAETFTRLDALGVAPENRNGFLTLASIVQKESGPNPEDPPKIARVFQNRIDQGIMLESDATTTYGTCVWGPTQGRAAPDTCGTVWLNQSDIDDTTNPYNTRALPGLPPGPIAMPGQAALEAVAHPADGPWLFFVAVNLATGETVFTETVEEHEAAVEQLYAWCEASDENASYCA